MSNIQKRPSSNLNLKGKVDQIQSLAKAKQSALAQVELPRLFYQLVIFVLDGSDSMNWKGKSGKSKGEEIDEVIKPIISRLKQSKNSNSFDISAWAYSEDSVPFLPITAVKKIDDEFDFNPTNHIDTYRTYVSETLKNSLGQAEIYLENNKGKNSQVLILLLSDGDFHDTESAIELSEKIIDNPHITLSSSFLETANMQEEYIEACQQNLIKMTSSFEGDDLYYFKSTVDPDEIRKHMIKSISTVSKIG